MDVTATTGRRYVLVHGAWHGAWCWERLLPELEALGQDAVAVDLPIEDGTATFEDYAEAVLGTRLDDDVVLVGDSLGSMVIPLVAARRPVRAMLFLCGVIPNFAGSPWDDAPRMEVPGTFDGLAQREDGAAWWSSLEAATNAFYGDCSSEDARWAYERLRPQNSTSLWKRPYPLGHWPAGRRIAICTLDDRAVTPEFSRHVCRNRLGVDPLELPGGHSPFLSRPAVLGEAMVRAVDAPRSD